VAEAGVKIQWKDKGLDKLVAQMKELTKLKATVGYQGADALETLEPKGATTAAIATFNEFGTKHIPARGFMRRGVKRAGSDLARVAAKELGAVVSKNADPIDAMGEIGNVLAEKIIDQLDTTRSWATPNAASTIKKKGEQYPPLDAGKDRLRKGLSWAVRENRIVVKTGKPT